MPTVLESRRKSAADDLNSIVTEIDNYLQREDADTESAEYVAMRENRDKAQGALSDLLATIDARRLAQSKPITNEGEVLSPMRRVLREYDRGQSEKFDIAYDLDLILHRELQTGDPYFTPNPTRIAVASSYPFQTPSLDLVRNVQTGQHYNFVIPPPPVAASTVAEGAQKPTRTWVSTTVEGTLETDAHLIDVTRQTLEDDASAERTLRAWLSDGVRLQQDAKAQAAIAGATGTLTATGTTVAEGLRNAKTELSAVGITATAAYLNPADAAALDLGQQGVPGYNGVGTVWGMRIVESPAIAEGSPIVGAISQAVYMLYRNSIQTYITDSGMTQETTPRDRFSHNLLGILAEGRSRVHVVAPQLLVKVTVAAVPPAARK